MLPGRLPGWIGTAAIFLAFLASIGALLDLLDRPTEERQLVDSAWTYAATVDFNVDLAILVDPLSVFMCLVVSGVSFLIHLYSVAYMSGDRGYARYFAYLNFFVFSMLLLVLAANFVILIIGLGVRRRGLVPADLVLVPARDRRGGRHQGVRDQRDRRRGAGGGRVPDPRQRRLARLPDGVRRRRRGLRRRTTARSWRPAC